MTQSLYEEIIAAVNARLEAGYVTKEIWMAAANEIPPHPAMEAWTKAQMRRSIDIKGYANEFEIVELAEGDELLQRRLEGVEDEVRKFIIHKLVDEEMDRRVKNGSVVEVARDDGETGYVRKEDV